MTHYGKSLRTDELLEWSNKAAKQLKKFLKDIPDEYTPMLCYRGMSGVTHATALALELTRKDRKFFHCYVRKEFENSHGDDVECNGSGEKVVLVFVDDFTSTGDTRRATLKKAIDSVFRDNLYEAKYIQLTSDFDESEIYSLRGFLGNV